MATLLITCGLLDMLGIASGSLCEVEKPILHDQRPLALNEDDYLRVCRVPKKKVGVMVLN